MNTGEWCVEKEGMKKHFITYGDEQYAEARRRIISEARRIGEFDVVKAYDRNDVSDEVKSSSLFFERRGGGYWCWKPDIIVSELNTMEDGDIIVYADSGCELVSGSEWNRYWRILEDKELIVQRIYQINERWTRRNVIDEFSDIPRNWLKKCQFLSGVLIAKKTSNTVAFFNEWRRYMITKPDLARDVEMSMRKGESPSFIENRHDQTVLTALIFRYMSSDSYKFIADEWEHVENQSLFRSQVIRAMRWNSVLPIPLKRRVREMIWRVGKDLLLKPLYVMKMKLAGNENDR